VKRLTIPSLVVCFLLLQGNAFAQQDKSSVEQGTTSTKWEKIKDGVWVQRLWSKNEWPQVAVLKLSDAEYKEFREDTAKFVNFHKVFPVKVNEPAGPGVSLSAPRDPSGYWLVLIGHGAGSVMYTAAVPEPPES
jgi:hypothetical protein